MRGWMNATRVGLIVAVCACAAQARAQAPATPAAQAASRVPLTTPAIQRFVTWLEAHPEFNETREKEYIQRLINQSHER